MPGERLERCGIQLNELLAVAIRLGERNEQAPCRTNCKRRHHDNDHLVYRLHVRSTDNDPEQRQLSVLHIRVDFWRYCVPETVETVTANAELKGEALAESSE